MRAQQPQSISPPVASANLPVAEFVSVLRERMDHDKLEWARDSSLEHVVLDILANRYINAIKSVREISGLGLRESKDLVDEMRAILGRN